MRPTTMASRRTLRRTCALEAPSARKSASSRVRWATIMAKVLKMRNRPTSTETNANASRK